MLQEIETFATTIATTTSLLLLLVYNSLAISRRRWIAFQYSGITTHRLTRTTLRSLASPIHLIPLLHSARNDAALHTTALSLCVPIDDCLASLRYHPPHALPLVFDLIFISTTYSLTKTTSSTPPPTHIQQTRRVLADIGLISPRSRSHSRPTPACSITHGVTALIHPPAFHHPNPALVHSSCSASADKDRLDLA
jgi:hypothetical protein